MIKERLKELDIKITELANYLQLSRPTVYKFIELYDNNDKAEINKSICDLFDYIEENELIGKNNVINYIINKMSLVKNSDNENINSLISDIKDYIFSNQESEKTQLIKKIINTSQYDLLIHYFFDITSISKKRKRSELDLKKLNMYEEIIKLYTKEEEK